jgi:hypothetical protein
MRVIGPLAVILAGLIAISGLIIARKPNAKQLLDKVTPYQAFLGVFLLVWGIIDFIRYLSWFGKWMAHSTLLGIAALGYIGSEILLGFLLGFGLIAKWIPGEGAAETRALELQKKVIAFQVPIGFIGIACALIFLFA